MRDRQPFGLLPVVPTPQDLTELLKQLEIDADLIARRTDIPFELHIHLSYAGLAVRSDLSSRLQTITRSDLETAILKLSLE